MPAAVAASSGRSALSSMCRSCRQHAKAQRHPRHPNSRRTLSSTSTLRAQNPLAGLGESLMNDPKEPSEQSAASSTRLPSQQRQAAQRAQQEQLATILGGGPLPGSTPYSYPSASTQSSSNTNTTRSGSSAVQNLFRDARNEASARSGSGGIPIDEPYHIHVYAHKHNTHITFTEPSRNPLLSFSCGNIGLRHAQRSSFDAAYQLSTYAMKKMAMLSWKSGGKKAAEKRGGKDDIMNPLRTIQDVFAVEVIMRGFGPGREPFRRPYWGVRGI
ncbi:uncharacterized protein AB675_6454 [Cyphellophora attinorum]|uniref:Uncharacterized protein n=1 Tax=Cyphellophora attinorum TaxID=1664694 RepID=A0A0N0NQB4_9EURO|nr:uncharacterized protein AB675_6454 [Phialophora attinorum]KPI43711.1 hypothetical protein AB675_6454 [Phialophora attinorum]